MIYESANRVRIENISKDELSIQLKTVNSSSNSYAYLENMDESYIQVGGGPVKFTVEVRKYSPDGSFTHWKAKQKGCADFRDEKILIGGAMVTVKANQIMTQDFVLQLFYSFIVGDYLSSAVEWDDITQMFQ